MNDSADRLRIAIIQALEPTPEGQDLESIHLGLNRGRRDLSLLPQVSALVTGGYIEKCAGSSRATSNSAVGAGHRRNQPVTFRLTLAGQTLLKTVRETNPSLVSQPIKRPIIQDEAREDEAELARESELERG